MNKGIILLSGGLDSYISLDIASKKVDIKLALTFDYGHKAFKEEAACAKKLSEKYNIKHKIIKLPFLKELTNNALTDEKNNNFADFNSVWVPNRNGLFINIAGSYCDKYDIEQIIMGINKEEASQFPDNSEEFIKGANAFLKYSTLKKPTLFAPCSKFDKIAIINYAIDNNLELNLIKSCYNSAEKTGKNFCGNCLSCQLIKNAIKKSKKPELFEELF